MLFPQDPNIIAIACDGGRLAQEPVHIPRLALDRADQICDFVMQFIGRSEREQTGLAG